MDFNSREMVEIDQRLTDVAAACYLQQRALDIRQSKEPAPDYRFVESVPGAIWVTATAMCSGGLLRFAGNGIKELRARAHERLANQIFDE